jgi:hypothetical protein
MQMSRRGASLRLGWRKPVSWGTSLTIVARHIAPLGGRNSASSTRTCSASEARQRAAPPGARTHSSSTPSSHPPHSLRSSRRHDNISVSMHKGRGSTASTSDMSCMVNVRRQTTISLSFHRSSLFGYLRSNPAIHSINNKFCGAHSFARRRENTTASGVVKGGSFFP